MTAPLRRSSLRAARLRWLLDLSVGGTTVRLASDIGEDGLISAPDVDGTERTYRDGLERPRYVDTASRDDRDLRVRSVAVTAQIDRVTLDLPALRAAGHRGGTAILRLWNEEDDSIVVDLRGHVSRAEYRSRDGWMTFSLVEDPLQDRGLISPATAQVDTTTWPDCDPAVIGTPYPYIIGTPGAAKFIGTAYGATPALVVDDTGNGKALLAGHPCATGAVVLVNLTAGWASNLTVTPGNEADALGQATTTALGDGTHPISHGDEVWCAWTVGGGVRGHGGAAIRGLGDVLRWMLRQTRGIRLDWGRLEALFPTLNAWKIDCYIIPGPTERLSPWAWIQAHVLPLFPLSPRVGPQGLYLVLWDYDATTQQARETLTCWDVDPTTDPPTVTTGNVEAAAPVLEGDDEDVVNEVRLSFCRAAKDDNYRRVVRITGDLQAVAYDAEAIPDAMCQVSQGIYGTRPTELSTDIVSDAATATACARSIVRAKALPGRMLEYVGDQALGVLVPGDVVQVEDSEVAITGQLAHVQAVGWDDYGYVRLSARTLERTGALGS